MGEGIVTTVFLDMYVVVTKKQISHLFTLGGIMTQNAFNVILYGESMKKTITLSLILPSLFLS